MVRDPNGREMSPYAFGGLTPTSVDAEIGSFLGTLSDGLHPKLAVRGGQNEPAIAAGIAQLMR